MLVSQNKEMAAMLVSQTKPLGIELYFYANNFFCFRKQINMAGSHVHENALYIPVTQNISFTILKYIYINCFMDNILQVIIHTIRCCFTKQNCMTKYK